MTLVTSNDEASKSPRKREKPADPRLSRRAVRIQMTGVGLEFGASVIGGLAVGYYLDEWLGTEPVFVLLCVFGALVVTVTHLVALSRRLDRLRRADEEGSSDD